MKYYIDSNSKQSMYMQLYKQLREDIVNSVYKYGNKLPSKRLLASETLTSVITVEHAYSILCDEGYVESRERSGYYVTYRKKDFMPVGEVQESFNAAEQGYIHTDDEFPFSVFAKTMRNVISKYSDKNSDVVIKTDFSDKNFISIKVINSGIEIKDEDKERIFQKFSRIDNPLTREVQGSGLGLFITKSLVEFMNGSISVQSSNGQTIFEVLMPISDIENQARSKCSQKH